MTTRRRAEGQAVAGFLEGYAGNTRASYAADRRIFQDWCRENRLTLFGAHGVHLEMFGRWMEQNGRAVSTVARRLSTLASFYRYCHVAGLLARDPAANVIRPKVDRNSTTLGLDRDELAALLTQARLGSQRDHALITLLAMNGLRVSEVLGADVGDLDRNREQRTLRIVRRGGGQAAVSLAPTTAQAIDAYIGERCVGPIFLGLNGARMDRHAADRAVKRLARKAGITARVSPRSLRRSYFTTILGTEAPLGGGDL